jgi:Peptidase of plants and bacteria/F5/8 type C domain
MKRPLGFCSLGLSLALPFIALGSPYQSKKSASTVATVESSLATAGKQIRQFAFDGDKETYFASSGNPGEADQFTLVLEKTVPLKSIEVTTGRPGGGDELESGSLEVSSNGKTFGEVAKFDKAGVARIVLDERSVHAIRIKPDPALKHPLVIREIAVDSAQPVATFAYPVEFSVDVADAPEMKEWADKAARLCERWYPRLNEELKSDGYKPATQIFMTLRGSYRGVAAASGNRITGSVKFFKDHPDDLGAMIHETCHVIQRYRGGEKPGWLVEGIADHIRFFVFEPGKAGPVNPRRAHYNDSYRTTASFLDYVSRTYDKELVLKLNQRLREGKYKGDAWKELTGKTVEELDAEWLASLAK